MLKLKYLLMLFIVLFFGCALTNNAVQSYDVNEGKTTSKCLKTLSPEVCPPTPSKNYIYVIGKGAAPNDENLTEVQRYLLAERAAVIDGYRKLAEKLQGVILSTLTKAGNFVVNMDVIKVQTEALIRGAEIVDIQHNENGVCSAKIRIALPERGKLISGYRNYSKM